MQTLNAAIIGLGSTYRTVGRYQQSKDLLEKGIKQFDNQAMKVFLAMTLYNLKAHEAAMQQLLQLLAETSSDSSIRQFSEAIAYYADRLNDIW
jgi:tetratricopeptide (TPR) repeat protein